MKLVVLLLLFLLFSAQSYACSCALKEGTLQDEVLSQYNSADAVLIGKAIKIVYKDWEVEDDIFPPPKNWGVHITEFEVIREWKGSVGKKVSTKISPECCHCGYQFSEGTTYLLFLYGPSKKGNYKTSICTLTGWLEKSQEIIKVLDQNA